MMFDKDKYILHKVERYIMLIIGDNKCGKGDDDDDDIDDDDDDDYKSGYVDVETMHTKSGDVFITYTTLISVRPYLK